MPLPPATSEDDQVRTMTFVTLAKRSCQLELHPGSTIALNGLTDDFEVDTSQPLYRINETAPRQL